LRVHVCKFVCVCVWCVCACVRVCVCKRERTTFVPCSFALPFLLHYHATRSCFLNLPCRNAIMIQSCHIAATNCARVGCAGLHRLWVCVCLLSVRVFACVYACVCVGVCVWGCVSSCVYPYVIVACPCLLSHTHKNHATWEWLPQAREGEWAWDATLATLRSIRSGRAGMVDLHQAPLFSWTSRHTPHGTSALLELLRHQQTDLSGLNEQLRVATLRGREEVMDRWERMIYYRRQVRTLYMCFWRWTRAARVMRRVAALVSKRRTRRLVHCFLVYRSVCLITVYRKRRLLRTQRLINADQQCIYRIFIPLPPPLDTLLNGLSSAQTVPVHSARFCLVVCAPKYALSRFRTQV